MRLNIPAHVSTIPAEKNQAEFKVITPKIENKKVATKKAEKSLSKAF